MTGRAREDRMGGERSEGRVERGDGKSKGRLEGRAEIGRASGDRRGEWRGKMGRARGWGGKGVSVGRVSWRRR